MKRIKQTIMICLDRKTATLGYYIFAYLRRNKLCLNFA